MMKFYWLRKRTLVSIYPVFWIFAIHVSFCHLQDTIDKEDWSGPTFTTIFPKEISYLNTDGVTIPCSAHGNPVPTLEWFDQDGTLTKNTVKVTETFSNGSIYFLPFREESSRTVYRLHCRATNKVGAIVSEEILVKPVIAGRYRIFNTYLSNVQAPVNGTAVLHCAVNPIHVTEKVEVLSWKTDEVILTSGGRYSIFESGHLHVRNISESDAYRIFSCDVQNLVTGERKSSGTARIIIEEPVNSLPVLKDLPSLVLTAVGSSVELPCIATAYPLPVYHWFKNGLPVQLDDPEISQRGGNLLIRRTRLEDAGDYVCKAQNSLGQHSATIVVEATSPLLSYIEPSRQTLELGTPASFHCHIEGHPVRTIEWYHDGKVVKNSSRVILTDNATSLVILRTVRSDAGMYQCMVFGEADSAQGSAQLSISVLKPYIYEHFEEQFTQTGPRLSLKCVAAGTPTPVITWTLDGNPLLNESRITVSDSIRDNKDVVSFLTVASVQLRDGGWYRCTAENLHSADSWEAKINVYGIPLVRPMKNISAVANEILRVRCYVAGYPVNTIKWYKGDVLLPINHRQSVTRDGTLQLTGVDRFYDEGVYSCDARDINNHGSRESVYIQVKNPPKIDPFSFPIRKEGNRVSVSCVVSSGDLPMVITWQKNGEKISIGQNGIIIQPTGSYSSLLSIESASPIHNGNYTCLVSNEVASVNYTALLHVNVSPRWITEPKNSEVVFGQNVRIDCQASGDPDPTYTWKIGGQTGGYQDLLNNGSESFTDRIRVLSNGSLSLEKATKLDDGFYLCQASNGISPDISRLIRLAVHMPARAHVKERNFTVIHGQTISLECNASGNFPISIAWSFNHESIDWYNPRYNLTYFDYKSERGSKLTIGSGLRSDGGVYFCTVQNLFGSQSVSINVIILESPDPPFDLRATEIKSRKAELHWSVPFDGNSAIIAYIIEINGRTYLEVNSSVLSVDFVDLFPATDHIVQVFARNTIGSSLPSDFLTFTTEEEEPSGPPSKIEVVAVDMRTLRISWEAPLENMRNGKILGYYIGYKKNDTRSPYTYITKSSSETFCTVENLEKFTYYAVHVLAFNRIGPGPKSNDEVVLTLEDVPSQPPGGVQAVAVSSQVIMVSWLPPPLTSLNGILQGYKVMYKLVKDYEEETNEVVMITSQLSATILGLQKFSNYSIQVLAFTQMGSGIRSHPIYVLTQQDVPSIPADIKAVAAGDGMILVIWKAPFHPNGVIINYELALRDLSAEQTDALYMDMKSTELSHLVVNLSVNHEYGFRVRARTVIGNGDWTREVLVSNADNVNARIASFSDAKYFFVGDNVTLPCQAVGKPQPSITWQRNQTLLSVTSHSNIHIHLNGSLSILHMDENQTGDYVCRAENQYGSDEISFSIVLRVHPEQPVLAVAEATSRSIQISWKIKNNKQNRITLFVVHYRLQDGSDDWSRVELGPNHRSFLAKNLRCGSRYSFYVVPFSLKGEGSSSAVLTAKTNGSAPISPSQSLVLEHINSTYAILALNTWQTGGCPVTSFTVDYQVMGDFEVWNTVDRNIPPNASTYNITLRPLTWYLVRVVAYNEAGATECVLKFSTKPYFDSKLLPAPLIRKFTTLPIYHRMYFLIPLTSAIVCFVVMSFAVGLFCCQCRRAAIYQSDNRIAIKAMADKGLLEQHQRDDAFDSQIYVPDPGQSSRSGRNDEWWTARRRLTTCDKEDVDVEEKAEDAMVASDSVVDRCSHASLDVCNEPNDDELVEDTINPYATFPLSKLVPPRSIPPSYIDRKKEDLDYDNRSCSSCRSDCLEDGGYLKPMSLQTRPAKDTVKPDASLTADEQTNCGIQMVALCPERL